MTRSRHPHADEVVRPARPSETLDRDGELGAGLFTPEIRTPVPVAPGSVSSEQAAASVTDPMRARSHRLILNVLAAHASPMSRETIAEYTDIKESTLCARLSELRPLWVEAVEGVCESRAGVRVDGYRLSAAGRARMRKPA